MKQPIEPALSEDAWERFRLERSEGCLTHDFSIGDNADACAGLIAINNDMLPDNDPRKITRENLRALREAVNWARDVTAESEDPAVLSLIQRASQFADALASYLPPKGQQRR